MYYLISFLALQGIYILHLRRKLRAKDEIIFKVCTRSNVKNKRIQEYVTELHKLRQKVDGDRFVRIEALH